MPKFNHMDLEVICEKKYHIFQNLSHTNKPSHVFLWQKKSDVF